LLSLCGPGIANDIDGRIMMAATAPASEMVNGRFIVLNSFSRCGATRASTRSVIHETPALPREIAPRGEESVNAE
jgi:chloramphenicol 3-O-phosphotransferase